MSVAASEEIPTALQGHPLLFIVVNSTEESDLLKQISHVKGGYPDARIAVVSDHYRPHELIAAYRAGASGYFVEVNSCDAFVKSIQLVMMGETVFPQAFLSFVLDGSSQGEPPLQRPVDEQPNIPGEHVALRLSPREQAILSCLVEGNSNKCIARKIDIADATVKVHVKAILRKIGVQNRTQAAIWGMNNKSFASPSNAHAFGKDD
ncbi:LuxR C-terminal-related transcriptional regulator [Bradyrhizobium sp. DASA03120]|uniref:LuxR C-terminal-related transcriptional regulator n=1 Tax=Bradyrhizobium sp. SMVTL-02 TaxID=3395917 RepID=UPI003F709574